MRAYFLKMWGLSGSENLLTASPLAQLLTQVEETTREALDSQDEKKAEAEERQKSDQQKLIEHESSLLREDILELHGRLGTQLRETQLEELSAFVRHHWQELGLGRSADHLAEATLRAVARRLHKESLIWGWDRFCHLFQERKLEWPEPLGISPHASAEEYSQHQDLDRAILRTRFESGEILRMADLVLGVVPVWGAVFPDRGGIVWRHSTFEAVAGALALKRLSQMDRLAHQQRPELERRLTEVLTEPLRQIEEQLRSPFASAEEDQLLAERAREICQVQAAEEVWRLIGPQLQ